MKRSFSPPAPKACGSRVELARGNRPGRPERGAQISRRWRAARARTGPRSARSSSVRPAGTDVPGDVEPSPPRAGSPGQASAGRPSARRPRGARAHNGAAELRSSAGSSTRGSSHRCACIAGNAWAEHRSCAQDAEARGIDPPFPPRLIRTLSGLEPAADCPRISCCRRRPS